MSRADEMTRRRLAQLTVRNRTAAADRHGAGKRAGAEWARGVLAIRPHHAPEDQENARMWLSGFAAGVAAALAGNESCGEGPS